LRVIERAYGSEHDNAGDDMAYALHQVSEWRDQYRHRFSFDSTHPNPWYHAMVFEVEGIPDSVYARLVAEMAELGLVPEGI